MSEHELIKKILEQSCFQAMPPVLVDIGASGAIHPEWKSIAPFSICLAFDADDRDFSSDTSNSGFRKLILVNSIVSDKEDAETDFYLTTSPHCSSTLEPLNEELSNWS